MATPNYIMDAFESEPELLAQNPWYTSGIGVLKTPIQYSNSTEAILGPLLQGFGGGMMMGFGKQNVRDEQRPKYAELISSLSGSPYETEDDWSISQGRRDVLNALMERDASRDIEDKVTEAFIKDAGERGNLDSIGGTKIKVKRIPGGGVEFETEAGSEKENSTPDSNPLKGTPLDPITQKAIGIESTLRGKGWAKTQAGSAAQRFLEGERKRQDDALLEVKDLRSKSQGLRDLGERVLAAQEGAGATGNDFWTGLQRWTGRQVSGFSEEQRKKLAAEQELSATRPEVIKQNYIRGMAGLNQTEADAIVGSGAGGDKTPEFNKNFAQRMFLVADLNDQYSDAVTGAVRNGIPRDEIDQAWNQFKREHPIIKGGVLNTVRPKFDEWLQSKSGDDAPVKEDPVLDAMSQDVEMKQNPAGTFEMSNIPPGAEPTGRTSGGKPVYKLPNGQLFVE